MSASRIVVLLTAATVVAVLGAAGLATAGATAIREAPVTPTQSNVSSNWSGYVASGTDASTGAPASFSSVFGTWVQPTAKCSSVAATGATSSAFWVGMGGNATASDALEQAGTEADCSASGSPHYFAWYELVPAGSVRIKLVVAAGNKITASVGVVGNQVTVVLQNLTQGTSFSKTLTMARPDTSSVEWIAEAPSVCGEADFQGCSEQSLTDFGTVRFSGASATSNGHTGPISDPTWTKSPVVLQSGGGRVGRSGGLGFGRERTVSEAVPSTLTAAGSAFTVTWHQLSSGPPPGAYGGGFGGGFGGGSGGFGGGYGGSPYAL